jgi:uncharacterized repeat protein (TIGR04138 family)
MNGSQRTVVTPDSPIEADVICQKCRYNLRTLAVTARCPECGFPVVRSYIAFEAGVGAIPSNMRDPEQTRRVYQTAVTLLARLLGRNVDSIEFVLMAHRHARQRLKPKAMTPQLRPVDVPVTELCRSCVDYALEHYGNREDASATFRFWRLERSEDLGEIVSALVEAGLMTAGRHDTPSEFAGVCRFDHQLNPS